MYTKMDPTANLRAEIKLVGGSARNVLAQNQIKIDNKQTLLHIFWQYFEYSLKLKRQNRKAILNTLLALLAFFSHPPHRRRRRPQAQKVRFPLGRPPFSG